MKSITKRQRELETEAIHYLKDRLYVNNPDDCPYYLSLQITKDDKKHRLESYEEDLKIFKTLFHSDNENHRIALWNCIYLSDESSFYRKDFSKEEYDFLKLVLNAYHLDEYVNVNDSIKTDRLILRAVNKDDMKLFAYHFRVDGDFIIFSGVAPTRKKIKLLATRKFPTFFTIEEKTTQKVIGYVGLTIHQIASTGLLEYYIFKEYRRHGYCKEAIMALVNKTINQKLCEPEETIKNYIYKKKVIKLNAIRVRISARNIPSIELVKSCGFIHEATIHKAMHVHKIGWTDEELYYLPVKR